MSTYDESLLATMTKDEREAFLEGLEDQDMQTAIADVANLSDDEVKAALAGKDDEQPTAATGEQEGDQAPAADAGTQEETAPEAQAAPAAVSEPEETFRPVLRAELPDNIEQIKAGLQTQQDELERQFRDGELEFDEYRKQDRSVSAKLEQIRAAELKAHIYADQEQQRANQEWEFNQRQFFKRAKAEHGIDYTSDAKYAKDLDLMVRALARDPENGSKDAEFFLGEAHKRVLALHGIAHRPAKADPVADANAARKPPVASIPKTVGDLPGGSDAEDIGGGEFAHIDKLSGAAYERAVSKLSDDQRARYLAS